MHENSKAIFAWRCIEWFQPGIRVLECGPTDAVPSWYEHQLMERDGKQHKPWETADANSKRTNVTYHVGQHSYVTVASGTFDIVFSAMVAEHTPRPWEWFQEMARVCKPGGLVICMAPIVGPEHGDDYFRFWPKALESLAQHAGLRVESSGRYEFKPGDWRGPDTVHVDSLVIARKP